MKKILYFPMVILLLGSLIFTQCTSSNNGPVASNSLIRLANSSTLGSYLTDKNGYALYFFSNDVAGTNNCTGGCTANWPIFNLDGLTQSQLDPGLLLSDFSSIATTTGSQLTYKGWPLYTYSPGGVAEASGSTSGNGVGGIWFVAKPNYTIMLANLQLVGLDANNYVVSTTDVTSLGTGKTVFFTDQNGRTLYAFARDSLKVNKFTKPDFSNNAVWPIYVTSKVVIPSTLDKNLLFWERCGYGWKIQGKYQRSERSGNTEYLESVYKRNPYSTYQMIFIMTITKKENQLILLFYVQFYLCFITSRIYVIY